MAARTITLASVVADFATLSADDQAAVRRTLAITSSPAATSAAAQHWQDRDIACPRGCGRSDFRTETGAKGAHRNPKGETCK